MKKFLTVLLVIAVMFTFSFGSAFAAVDLSVASNVTQLVTAAQTASVTAQNKIDTLKTAYLANFADGKMYLDQSSAYAWTTGGTPADDDIVISKAVMEANIDLAFGYVKAEIEAACTEIVEDINDGSFASASYSPTCAGGSSYDNDDLATGIANIKALINGVYAKYDTVEEIDAFLVTAFTGSADFREAILKAEFDAEKADALANLNSVNYDNYSTEAPTAATYTDAHGSYYYSTQQIAKALVNYAVTEIGKIAYTNATYATAFTNLNTYAAYVTKEQSTGIYYVTWQTGADASLKETTSEVVAGETYNYVFLTRASNDSEKAKTLAEEKAYQISVVEGQLGLAKAAVLKAFNADYKTFTTAATADATKAAAVKSALDRLDADFANLAEVAAAQINYPKAIGTTGDGKSTFDGTETVYGVGEDWKNTLDTTVTTYYAANTYLPTNLVKNVATAVAAVDAAEAKAAAMKAQSGFDGSALYDATAVDTALKADVKTAYTTYAAGTALSLVPASSDLVKAAMANALTGGVGKVKIENTLYDSVDKWYTSASYDAAEQEVAEDLLSKVKTNIRAAKSVADVQAAFLAGLKEFKAIPTTADKSTYVAANATAINAYKAKLAAAYATKIANTTDFATKYDKLKFDADLVDNLVIEFLNDSSDDTTLEANYNAALAVIEGLKSKAELTAEKKAIETGILAVKTPVTLDKEAEILALVERVEDFEEYQTTVGLYSGDHSTPGTFTYAPLYTSLLTSYVTNMDDLVKADLDKKVAAIGTVDLADEAAIDALSDAIDAFNENYSTSYGSDYTFPASAAYVDVDAMYAALDLLKIAEVEGMIAAIDAKADPLDAAAVKAAREAYDALGESTINVTYYNKLIALETALAKEGMSDEAAKAYVQDLSIKARSTKTSKGVKVTIKADVQELLDNGYTVEYKFYRSTKSNKNFGTAMITKTTGTYTNTKGVKGTKYYYKAKLVVKNAEGEVVATTPLTQCLYATRTF